MGDPAACLDWPHSQKTRGLQFSRRAKVDLNPALAGAVSVFVWLCASTERQIIKERECVL